MTPLGHMCPSAPSGSMAGMTNQSLNSHEAWRPCSARLPGQLVLAVQLGHSVETSAILARPARWALTCFCAACSLQTS